MLLRMSVLVLCMSCLCLWLGKLSVLVSADYVVQVEVLSYSNPFNRRSDGQCCDSSREECSGVDLCDTYFIYCLMPHASTAEGCSNNKTGDILVTSFITDGADIDFSQPIVLGLSNPFNLTGISTAWEGAQLYIQVLDSDSRSEDLIARYRFDLSLSVESTEPFSASSSTEAVITLSATVLCAPFYSGSICDIFNHCESNAVTCSDQGTCTNDLDSYTCVCNAGYTGADCEDIDDCEGQNCSGNGDCMNEVNSYTCVCNAGYTGADCEVDIDECLLMERMCSGHGNCSHGIASFTCSCDPGYTGQKCEIDIDDCVNVNCSGQGNCTDRVNGFDCDCFPGYTDTICQTDIDECDGINCSGNGGCVDMVNMFLCDCEPGYTGADCETNINDCVNRNCSGNGVCVDGVNSFSCESLRGAPWSLIGGMVGGLLVLMLILLLLIVVVVVCVRRRAQGKTIQDTHSQGDTISYIPGDNPVYGIPENRTNRTNTITSETAEFDNPIYGSQELLNDAEFVNPIYGDADFEDVPYELAPAISDYETPSTCV
ncbi:protein crumbs-like isoform X2 [Halichondria panicea]|uniref:protein crumbs-like isoform X2 n=1 Tax=Halichondria panicea TaxID=6063 RepID=UPI00312B4880